MWRELLQFVLRPLAAYCERHLVLWLDFGGDAPPPPDYTPVANASKEAAEIAANLGREQLNEARWQYDQNMAVARPVAQAQLDIMRQTADQARDYYEYGKTFRPLEQQMLRQAQGELTPSQIVRLGVSGLNLPTLKGRAGSANVIADAAKRAPAAAPAPEQRSPGVPLLRFASGTGGQAPSPRFPGRGVLQYLGASDTGRMLDQQSDDPPSSQTTWADPSPAIKLPPLGARPPAPDPGPTSTQFDALKTDILAAIDERLKRESEIQQSRPNWFGDYGN